MVKPELTTNQKIRVEDWARSLNQITVELWEDEFFTSSGVMMIDSPVLPDNADESIKSVIEKAIIQSGGVIGAANAPSLHIEVEDYNFTLESTGSGINSISKVSMQAELEYKDGRSYQIQVGSNIKKAEGGVITAGSFAPRMNQALTEAVRKLLRAELKPAGDSKSDQGVTSASGTCFAVHPDGWLITANHVIDDGKVFDVKFGNVLVRAEVIVRDDKHDLALLKVGVPTPHYLSIVEDSDHRLGTDVYTLGYPLSGILSQDIRFNKGTISALSSFKDSDNSEGLYQVSVPVQPGNSGGPLMHEDGTVVGVVVAKVSDLFVLKSTGVLPQNISFAIDSDYIHELLITAGVALPPHIARSIEEASKATYLLIVE